MFDSGNVAHFIGLHPAFRFAPSFSARFLEVVSQRQEVGLYIVNVGLN